MLNKKKLVKKRVTRSNDPFWGDTKSLGYGVSPA